VTDAAVGTILFFTSGEEAPSRASPQETAEAGVPVFTWDGLGASMHINF